jgi:hypothetical protein
MQDLHAGHTKYIHYFGQEGSISLKKEDVACFVFWSKDYTPFLGSLHEMLDVGYRSYFNYTLTNLPAAFETNVNHDNALRSLKVLSRMYSPEHINWRYDPIVLSSITDYDWHVNNFKDLCLKVKGFVKRCYFNFLVHYGKVQTNLNAFTKKSGIKVYNPDNDTKTRLITAFVNIARESGIQLFSCAESHGYNPEVQRAHCIDAAIINQLYHIDDLPGYKPSRQGCCCTQSTDIGSYNTCNHGCIYCYANTSSTTIKQALR